MQLKFKVQQYQTDAVLDVVECFAGQPNSANRSFRIDPGRSAIATTGFGEGFRNADLELSQIQILENINKVQRRRRLPLSKSLDDFAVFSVRFERNPASASYKKLALAASDVHLDIEMETGTGKTYCYLKTILELNNRYGWSKFIVIVPSIAIREGVYKTLQITADHFSESYGKRIRYFIYNSKNLNDLEGYSADAGINVMVINIQAFNSRGADNQRIYRELDDFQSRKPVDVIAANRPILILDEPQKMEGRATLEALPKFKPLFILRYSATHRTEHNKVHRLDALDAFNQKLVKKIAVRGIKTRGLAGTNAYLYLEGIETSKKGPIARLQLEVRLASGEIRRQLKRIEFRDDLFVKSQGLEQYRGFTISDIDAVNDVVEFTNGNSLAAGEACGDVSEMDIRRIQIRETIKAHLQKEEQLFSLGIKVLSLFFIDEVIKYRDYDAVDEKGEYARIFEEEYESLKEEHFSQLDIDSTGYRDYLENISTAETHNGYFSIDKRTNRLRDPTIRASTGASDDVDAYDLILKDKERLLSFSEATRFIFSHSALREGWDNPNVFVMCMLKHSDNTISRRQEVGRGLRLSVDRHGNRIDQPALVHEVNLLTVVASESYEDFVAGLQQEISETLSSRPRQANEAYFIGKTLDTDTGRVDVTASMAKQLYRYLLKNDYTDDSDHITETYHVDRKAQRLADLPANLQPFESQILQLIDSVFCERHIPRIYDGRKPKVNRLNANFERKEFQDLWERINRKAIYKVDFDSAELIGKCVEALDSQLRVTPLTYVLQTGTQNDGITDGDLRAGNTFSKVSTRTERGELAHSQVKYDLVGKVAEATQLTRSTAAKILVKIKPAIFEQFKQNPEHFLSEASRIIVDQKASAVVECLSYDVINDRYDIDIFMSNQVSQDFSRASSKLENHIYDYAILDSEVERSFVEELEASEHVVVYAKLPRGFLIPTPVGAYNPDWAISFATGACRHVYFVAETKGTMSTMQLRGIEDRKIDCARRFFSAISSSSTSDPIRYEVVTDYSKLLDLVS